ARRWRRLTNQTRRQVYARLDRLYLPLDKSFVKRARNLRLIPLFADRRGGKQTYVEWGFMIGIFQTLLNVHLENRSGCQILDVGCGTGLMAIASEPFVQDGGRYTGIDVSLQD